MYHTYLYACYLLTQLCLTYQNSTVITIENQTVVLTFHLTGDVVNLNDIIQMVIFRLYLYVRYTYVIITISIRRKSLVITFNTIIKMAR